MKLIQGDCLEVLRTMDANSVHCVVTSPPYFGLRDYGVDGQIGLEQTPDEYVAKMVDVFRGVRRVLRGDGVVWLNLGDSYAGGGRNSGNTLENTSAKQLTQIHSMNSGPQPVPPGLKPKDLIGIPWRVAFALQADGWWLRSEIIWHKPNPMPESVTDRPTKSHEQIFLLTKSARYFYDAEAVKEPAAYDGRKDTMMKGSDKYKNGFMPIQSGQSFHAQGHERWQWVNGTPVRNRRSVWTVATKPFTGAHFAVFPPKLIEPCVLAGCPEKCCPVCGAGWERVVERTPATSKKCPKTDSLYQAQGGNGGKRTGTIGMSGGGRIDGTVQTLGFQPTCTCNATNHINGTVLDPFSGAGTTGIVAFQHNRNFIGIELNPEYIEIAQNRIDAATRQMKLF